jgi:hypothetical protein
MSASSPKCKELEAAINKIEFDHQQEMKQAVKVQNNSDVAS